VANSRAPETLSDLAAETGATAVSVPEAVRGVDLIVFTMPEKNIPGLPAARELTVRMPVSGDPLGGDLTLRHNLRLKTRTRDQSSASAQRTYRWNLHPADAGRRRIGALDP
jgi:hypothetical protein